MLHAIDNNKCGRNFTTEEINWRTLFKQSEDSLTSSVLGTIVYLPEELILEIFSECHCKMLPAFTKITEIHFWPSWDASNTGNTVRVEPDVIIRTDGFDLIIEAKTENASHFAWQWKNECKSYKNMYGQENKEVIFFALGGKVPFDFSISDFWVTDIIKCSWMALLFACKKVWERNYAKLRGSEHRIFHDIDIAFFIHGFVHIKWLDSLNMKVPIENSSYNFLSSQNLVLNFLKLPPSEIQPTAFSSLNKKLYA